MIKRVASASDEVKILQFLTTPEAMQDPMNHCVPLLDVFQDPSEPEYKFMVLPLLRKFDDPDFATIGEVLNFLQQILEASISLMIDGIFSC